MKRLVTAAVLIPTVLYAVFLGPAWVLVALVALISGLCFWEYSTVVGVDLWLRSFALVIGASLLLVPLGHLFLPFLIFVLVLVALPMGAEDMRAQFTRSTALAMGVPYIFGAMRTALLLHDRGPWWLFFPLALTWIGDSAAYYVGRRFGRHKLAPKISPGKSIEGSAASALASTLFTMTLMPHLVPEISVWSAGLIGVLGNIAGQIGDLAESALKRVAGVKDSGRLLPGHGGMLDRVDSSLFTLPVVYALVAWVK